MANKLVSEMRLPPHLAHLLAARRLTTGKDVLSLPEVELMAVLDADLPAARRLSRRFGFGVLVPPNQPPRQALALLEERVRLGLRSQEAVGHHAPRAG